MALYVYGCNLLKNNIIYTYIIIFIIHRILNVINLNISYSLVNLSIIKTSNEKKYFYRVDLIF